MKKRWFISNVSVENDKSDIQDGELIHSAPAKVVFNLNSESNKKQVKRVREIIENSNFYILDLKTGKKYPIK